MKILVVRQIHSMRAAFSSKDVYVCRTHEAVDLCADDDSLFDIPVKEISIDNDRVLAWLDPDRTFYDREGQWSDTPEYKDHVDRYLKDGWTFMK